MTEEQKEFLIAKMLDTPASLTDEELEDIVSDTELRDIYEVSAAVAEALSTKAEFDLADEWVLFRKRLKRRRLPLRQIFKAVACIAGIITISVVFLKTNTTSISDNVPAAICEATTADKEAMPSIPISPEATLPPRMTHQTTIAPIKHPAPSRKKEAAAQELPPISDSELEEYLDIQQARIENDLAMLNAEAIIDDLNSMYDDDWQKKEAIRAAINTIIML